MRPRGSAAMQPRTAVERVMVACAGVDRRAGVDVARQAAAHSRARRAGATRSARSVAACAAGLAIARSVPAAPPRSRSTAPDAGPRAAAASAAARSGRSRTAARHRRKRKAASPFGLDQRLELAAARPRERSGWNACSTPRSSERGRFAPRATSATRPCSSRERLDDEARLAIRIRMQDEAGSSSRRSRSASCADVPAMRAPDPDACTRSRLCCSRRLTQ